MSMPVIVYCRTSSQRQKEHDTIGAQIAKCKALLAHHGLTPLAGYGPKGDGWIMDDGVPGSLLEGRTFSSFLDDLESRKIKIDHLVTYSLSRVSRIDRTSKKAGKITASHVAAARIQGVLISSGVSIVDEDGILDPASLTYGLKSMIAAEEYKMIRGRTMAGKSRHFAEGRMARGGKPAYGYDRVFTNGVDRKQSFTLVPSPVDAPNLELIFAWYLDGGATYAATQATLAKIETPMGDTTTRKNRAKTWTATRWCAETVTKLVRNSSVYLGSTTFDFDGEIYTIKYPPLITASFHAQLIKRSQQRILKNRATMLTTGYTDCVCGAHVNALNSHGRLRARCAKACGRMPMADFEAYVYLVMVCRLAQILEAENGKGSDTGDERLEVLRGVVEDYTQRIQELISMVTAKEITKDDWRSMNTPLQAARAAAAHELEQALGDRRQAKAKAATEASVTTRITELLREFTLGTKPDLARQRQVLGDVLGGGRAVIKFVKPGAEITFPAFGSLPAVTVSTTDDIFGQMLPNAQDRHGLYVSLRDLGKPPAAIARGYEAGLPAGATVTGRKVLDDGTISLTVETKPKRPR
jgi:DNA invertase Pin-like site-specific DNA recombinase